MWDCPNMERVLPPYYVALQVALLCFFLGSTAGAAAVVVGDAYILRLQFDGSHRPPRDHSFPTSSLSLIGTASACLSLVQPNIHDSHEGDNNHATSTLWLGGKAMLPGTVSNSAEAEYEGLLLGLGKTVNLLQDGQLFPTITTATTTTKTLLVIEGDCKTVIDQLRESSRPRKLKSHYRRAQTYLDQIIQNDFGVTFQLQLNHIPRAENRLCDGICNVIRSQIIEQNAQQSALQCIQQLERSSMDATTILSRCILDQTRSKSLIPYSKRPYLYHQLVMKVRGMSDDSCCQNLILIDIGERMELEAKTIWSKVPARQDDGKELQVHGIRLQIEGLQGLATRASLKAAMAQERKNRFLLEKYQNDGLDSLLSLDKQHLDALSVSSTQEEGEENINRELESLWETWLEAVRTSDEWEQNDRLWLNVPVRDRLLIR